MMAAAAACCAVKMPIGIETARIIRKAMMVMVIVIGTLSRIRSVTALPRCSMAVKMLRSSVLSQMDADYVRTAYSRGNSARRVMYHHVLKNALIPVLTFWGMTIADIVANSIILEQVFSIPGMGSLLITSISNRDYPVVQGILVLIAALVIIINFVVDLLYGRIDPRIRVQDGKEL